MSNKMTIEETINGLQEMIESKKFIENHYDGVVDEDACERAIELLKEQKNEPQLVIDKQNLGDCISAFCPNCGRGLYDKNGATKYCYNCGKAVKWDG